MKGLIKILLLLLVILIIVISVPGCTVFTTKDGEDTATLRGYQAGVEACLNKSAGEIVNLELTKKAPWMYSNEEENEYNVGWFVGCIEVAEDDDEQVL